MNDKKKQMNKEQENVTLDFPIKYSDELNAKLKESFWKCNDDSKSDSSLHYYLEIPNNVKPTNLTEKNIPGIDTIKEIASYRRIDDAPYIEVQVVYQPLKHEINPSDWLYNLLDITKETIIDKREIKGDAGIYLDALSIKEFPNGEKVVSRSTAQKNYDPATKTLNIVSVKVSCSLKDYPNLSEEIMAIATGWNFINKSNYQLGEDLKRLDTKKKNNLSFYFPNSWNGGKFIPKDGNPERVAIFNKNDNKETKGAINIFISELKETKEKLYNQITERFTSNDITLNLSELEKNSQFSANNYYNEHWQSIGTIIDKSKNFQGSIRISIVKTVDELILIELVGPNKVQDYYNAARNNRAFDLLLQTLQTSEKITSFAEDEDINEEKIEGKKGFFNKLFS